MMPEFSKCKKVLFVLFALPLSGLMTLLLTLYPFKTWQIFLLLFLYTSAGIIRLMHYYRQREKNIQAQMKAWVQKEYEIDNQLLLINTEEKLKNALALEIEQCAHEAYHSTIVVFDIDDLGQINNRFGYAAGDEVIIEVIKLSKAIMGKSAKLARVKGDTFAAIFPHESKQTGYHFAQSMNRELLSTGFYHGIRVTCRFVILTIDGWTTDDQLLDLAYEMLEEAKEQGPGVILK